MVKEQLSYSWPFLKVHLSFLWCVCVCVCVRAHTHTHLLCTAWNRSRQLLGWWETAEAASLSHRTAGGVRRHVGNDLGEESSVSCQDCS